ncbi:MAG: hypothetical protein IPG86_00060 [Chitinophagaceae bacterium]|nr:hypothetical protein [Chitinophagaceae bacterium]
MQTRILFFLLILSKKMAVQNVGNGTSAAGTCILNAGSGANFPPSSPSLTLFLRSGLFNNCYLPDEAGFGYG